MGAGFFFSEKLFDSPRRKTLSNAMGEEQQDHALKVELGFPNDATPVRLMASWRIGKKKKTFHFELFGRYIDTAAEKNPVGIIVQPHGKHQSKDGLVFQVWRQTVTCDGSSVYGELHWQPDTGERNAIRGLTNTTSKQELDLIWEGLKLFSLVREKLIWISSAGSTFKPLGRPIGSVTLTQNSFSYLAVEAYKKLHDLKLRDSSKFPTQQEVAQELLISRATLIRYLKSYAITWNDVRKKAIGVTR